LARRDGFSVKHRGERWGSDVSLREDRHLRAAAVAGAEHKKVVDPAAEALILQGNLDVIASWKEQKSVLSSALGLAT
jgi:RNase H-fold protein (predicted Holliday junction resolvase)